MRSSRYRNGATVHSVRDPVKQSALRAG